MPNVDNKALSRTLFEKVWNANQTDLIPELVSPDLTINDPYNPVTTKGVEAQKTYLANYKKAIPDLMFRIEDQVAEGDFVVNFVTATGTHEGELIGIPPTHKKATVNAIVKLRFANGKIVSTYTLWDTLAFMKNVGVLETLTEAMMSHR